MELPSDIDRVDLWIVMASWGRTYQARMWSNTNGHMIATAKHMQHDTLEEIRGRLEARGCTVDQRRMGKVIEVWIEPWKEG